MTAPFPLAGAAEFPNDNPELHDGARWVCLAPRGPARAVLRPRLDAAPPAPLEPRPEPAPAPRLEDRYRGPLELDLGRILLVHRVEDVPPPPDFIFVPFVPSAGRSPAEARATPLRPLASCRPAQRPIAPSPCRAVDEREARRRVDRGRRVDVAPCVPVGPDPGRRPARRRTLCTSGAEPEPQPVELDAVSA